MRALLIAAALAAAAAPAAAQTAKPAQTSQLAAGVQRTLDVLGFREVDARSLITRQLAAIHLNVAPRAPGFGSRWINLRQEVKVILGWDGYETRG
ncbi:hypothetical protein JQC91_02900 [Jannaschia sp. Os4]|uniref:hypothetical protein n=1 Tax=Jannaschia sp. Os4 TaxID=2807617 RepID=UPI00193A9736|nr:hypothetical protein [Jannaschia sp. Os4]MBM2575243.1 hypothetical protein [Jannaschia sp. Os4]